MTNHFSRFKQLHQTNSPLILLNVWDAASAVLLQQNDAQALATSSASLAWANGYADGGSLPTHVLLEAVQRIIRVSHVPLSVDIEAGYSDDPDAVAALVSELVKIGVCGINLEDGEQPAELLCQKIRAIKQLLEPNTVFINARTDVYLRQLAPRDKALDTCISRASEYIKSGADGIFIPGLTAVEAIHSLHSNIKVPMNVMASNSQIEFQALKQSGANRISFGPAPFLTAYSQLQNMANLVTHQPTAVPLRFVDMNELF